MIDWGNAMKQNSKFKQFLTELDTIPDKALTRELVKDLILRHFAGYKVSCSPVIKLRLYRENLAYQLLLTNTSRAEIAHILTERLQISRQWAITLVNRAIQRRHSEMKGINKVAA
jgi:hypothetical protein